MFSFLLDKYPQVGMGYMVNLQKLSNCFSKWLYHFPFPPAMNEFSCSPCFPELDNIRFKKIYFRYWNKYI